jgi:hypothetical protein
VTIHRSLPVDASAPAGSRGRNAAFLALALAIFVGLTAVMTFPQVLRMSDGVHDPGDPLMVTWVLAWVAHQLPNAPAHIFDANIFYPERRALAFSETLIVPAAIVAPLHWIGVGPLLVYNIVFLSGFIVSGAGVALLVRSLTGSAAAGVIAGIVFGFLPYRIDHYPHLQLQQTQCLPFAFWAFHRLLQTGRLRDGVLFGAFTAGQVLSCMYYGLFLVPYMAVVCGALLVASRTLSKERLLALVAAGAIALVAVVPVGKAYLGARQVVGERAPDEVADRSATWENYLGPPEANLIYGEIFKRFAASERRLFPGFVAVALALVALWPRHSPTHQVARSPIAAYAMGLVVAFDMSLGFNGITYGLLYEYVLPFRGLRIPARMGVMVGFSLAILAGYGAARLAGAIRSPERRRTFWVAVAVLMLAEYASKPLDLRRIPTSPPESYADIVRDRGDSPTATLFEFPASPYDDPTYMYYSTFHWQHLVNGYSGFFPPSYQRVQNAMREFPGQAAFDAIKAHGARYLVVHGERLFGARYEELIPMLDRRPDLKLVSRRPAAGGGETQEISVYRISYSSEP